MQRIMSSIVGLAGICLLAACQSPAGQLATVAPAASVPLDEPIQVAGVVRRDYLPQHEGDGHPFSET